VLDFFAGDCGFCKKQMPRVQKIHDSYADKGVRFINVAQKMRRPFTEQQLRDVFKQLKINPELSLDMSNKIGKKFQATSYPTMVVLGKTGKVELVKVGNVATLERDLTKKLDSLLGIKKSTTAVTPSKASTTIRGSSAPSPTLLPMPVKVKPVSKSGTTTLPKGTQKGTKAKSPK